MKRNTQVAKWRNEDRDANGTPPGRRGQLQHGGTSEVAVAAYGQVAALTSTGCEFSPASPFAPFCAGVAVSVLTTGFSSFASATGLVTREAARDEFALAALAAFFFMHMRLARRAGESSHPLFLGEEGRLVTGVAVSSYHFAGA